MYQGGRIGLQNRLSRVRFPGPLPYIKSVEKSIGLFYYLKVGENMKYVPDNLMKCQCLECERQFIVSDYQARKIDYILNCPYCKSEITEPIAGCNEDLLDELGCFGIYHYE